MNKLITIIACLIGLTAIVNADDFSSLIDQNTLNTLQIQGQIVNSFKESDIPGLIPDVIIKSALIEQVKKVKPTIGVEVLLYEKKNSNSSLMDIFVTLNAVSKLKGLDFYSYKDKKTYVFIKDAYTIDDCNKRIQDYFYNTLPSYNIINTVFEDPNFGKYNCTLESQLFSYGDNSQFLTIKIVNKSTINMNIIPIVSPGNSSSVYMFFCSEDAILFYGMHWIKSTNLFGILEGQKGDLQERIKMIFNYTFNRIDKASVALNK